MGCTKRNKVSNHQNKFGFLISFDSHITGCTKRNKVSNHKNKFGFLSQKMLSEGSPNHRDILKTVMGSSWIARTILFEFIIFYSRYLNV